MPTASPQPILLKDYQPTPYTIDSVALDFQLDAEATRVTARLALRPNPASTAAAAPLVLDGEMLTLESLTLDGAALGPEDYSVSAAALTLARPPQRPFTLEIVTTINPTANTALSGLYMSNGMFCTQCEAEGFRRITYFYDRPDCMARFSVRMRADAARFRVLLSNGNLVAEGPGFAQWDDPFPKPCYLFALVAGELGSIHDSFSTASGRQVALGIYVEKGKEDQCGFAMAALKRSMAWDEARFGREYDLDRFNIVAVSDFNMGAMENKGLNIFNDKYILARAETATDADHMAVESVIAHEYFHNWTGNRITCRDWFQLCLKEGLTVFRDQEFSSDVRSRAVKRIADVKTLRARQFPEDGGPLAHPARPSSYIEINNFYTPTVYEKGAEICRMVETLVGAEAFRRGMDLYFARHDGEACTVEQFIACFAEVSGRDLGPFFTWYEQAGTPRLSVSSEYDAQRQRYSLHIAQHTPATPGQTEKKPLHMPLGLGLLDHRGEDMALTLEGVGVLNRPVIELTEAEQTFVFHEVRERPVLSLNRGFSAPVIIAGGPSAADQLFLMGHDRDACNRWEAGQRLASDLITAAVAAARGEGPGPDVTPYAQALARVLADDGLDDAFKALMLGLPTEAEIAAQIGSDVDADAVSLGREHVRGGVGRALMAQLAEIFAATTDDAPYQADTGPAARRALRYAALALMAAADGEATVPLIRAEIAGARSMTAEMGALAALLPLDLAGREEELDAFYQRHSANPLLVDKWLMLNAQMPGPEAAQRVAALTEHPAFSFATPNRVYALIGGFTSGNLSGFNAAHGEGYRVLADVILRLDAANPQVAARLATGLRSWRLFNAARRVKAQGEMQRILDQPGLSRDVYEIISRTLQG
jgi:aminopeptidase N